MSYSVKTPNRRRVIYVKSTPNPQSRKKARLSPPEVSSRVASLVPSSQSDEEDLTSMKEQTYPPTLTWENDESMEISVDNNPISEPTTKSTSTNCHSRTPNSTSHSTDQMLTSPVTDHSFSAPTPLPLDPATKAAQIIAQIKARAYAKSQSSPEMAPLEFNDDLDDSSDDDSFLPILPFVTKPVSSKANILLAAGFEDTSMKPTPRYSLRSRSPTRSSSSSSPSLGLSRGSPPRRYPSPPKVLKDHTGKAKKTYITYDPFDALLKEKKLAEKSGKGRDAIRRAETTTDKFGKDGLLDGLDHEDDFWNDQVAAALAVQNRDWLINRPLTPDSSKGNIDSITLGDADSQKLFGEDGGKAVMGILEHDKIAKREVLNRQVPGLRFWSLPGVAHSTTMVVNEAPVIPEISATRPLICLLKKSIQCGDLSRAALILNMDVLSTIKPFEESAMVRYLCELGRTLLSEPASRALESHWNLRSTTCGLSFSQVLIAVQRLGVDVALLSSQKWPVDSMPYAEDVTTEVREDFIRRLVILVNACARGRKLRTEEAPDLVLLLLLIDTDISTSHDLQLDIIQAINLVCNFVTSEDMDFEVALCSKVLNCIAGYEPMNKARVIASLSAGSGSTKRIASFIAYCVIIDRTTAPVDTHSDLPPLDDVLEQLHPPTSLGSSKFSLSATTNYLDLGYYISILAIALSNVRGYVTEERREPKTKHSTSHRPLSPHKRMESPKDLQLVYIALETLHSNISDSKALHLERSRTKATLKGLSMYIHYQRDYWLKHDRGPQSKKLLHYFKKAP
ncbi:hypothetical protein BYT27DRAFT_7212091 [Phlegmacium glaucopus]|nr:hypothetical protein BYT27DRAFT_7212091 [Phlegmacium glaucopus]